MTWANDMKAFKEEMHAEIGSKVEATSKFVYRSLVSGSPLWAGGYVDSHRTGVNRYSSLFMTVSPYSNLFCEGPYYPPRMGVAEAIAHRQRMLDKIDKFKKLKTADYVVINNSAPYAEDVEADYHLYAKTLLAGQLFAEGFIKISPNSSSYADNIGPDDDSSPHDNSISLDDILGDDEE